jgi:hypothetical protein
MGGSASVAMSVVHTTPPKDDKAGASSAEAPMAQALVAQPGSMALNDTLADYDRDLLNFGTAESEIICQMSSRLQSCWPDSGKPDCSVWDFGWSSFHAP